jgi:glycine cleavage system H lipoate-binding protein
MPVILVVVTFLVFLAIEYFVRHGKARPHAAGEPEQAHLFKMRVPEGILFSRSHTWIDLSASGRARLGIDDFLGNVFKGAQLTLVKSPDDEVRKGDPLFVISGNGRALVLRAPITGEVMSVNEKLEGALFPRRTDLLGDDWFCTIRPAFPREFRSLLLGSESKAWMSEELCRLRDFLAATAANAFTPAVLQDGGIPRPGALLALGPAAWKAFAHQFLRPDPEE